MTTLSTKKRILLGASVATLGLGATALTPSQALAQNCGAATGAVASSCTTDQNLGGNITINDGVIVTLGGNHQNGKTIDGTTAGVGQFTVNASATADAALGGSTSLGTILVNDGKDLTLGNFDHKATTLSLAGAGGEITVNTDNKAFTGNILGATDGAGKIDVDEIITVTGSVGSASNTIAVIDIAAGARIGLTGSLDAADVDMEAADAEINFTGTGITVEGAIDGDGGDNGVLDFDGNATVTATIGGNRTVAEVEIANTKVVTVNDTVLKALNVKLEGATSELHINNTAGSTTTITGNIIAENATNNGILDVDTSLTVAGAIGATGGNALADVQIANGAVLSANNHVDAINVTFQGATAELNLTGGSKTVDGDLNGTAAGFGVLDIDAATVIDGNIGNNFALNTIEIADTFDAQVTTGTVVKANAITLQGATSQISFNTAGLAVTGAINASTAGQGIVHVENNTTFNSAIGNTAGIATFDVDDNMTATLNGNLTATNITFDENDAEIQTETDGVIITGTLNGQGGAGRGFLDINANTTVVGTIGAGTQLEGIDVATGKTLTITGATVNVDENVTVNGTGTLKFTQATTLNTDDATAAAGRGLVVDGTGTLDLANTLTLNGDGASFAAGTTLKISGSSANTFLNAATNSQAVEIAGNFTVDTSGLTGVTNGGTVTVIDATGGTYAGVTGTLTVTDNSRLINYTAADDTGDNNKLVLTANFVSGAQAGVTGPYAGTLDNLSAAVSGEAGIFQAFNNANTAADTQAASERLIVDLAAGGTAATVSASTGALNTVSSRTASLRDAGITGVAAGDGYSVGSYDFWLQGFAGAGDQDDRDGVRGFEADTFGIAVGVDTPVSETTRLGAAFSYADTEVDSDAANNAQTEVDSYQLTLYGTYKPLDDAFYVDGSLAYAWNEVETSRLSPALNTLNGEYDANTIRARAEVGKEYAYTNVNVTPSLAFDYIYTDPDSYTETGGTGAQRVSPDEQSAFIIRPGVQLDQTYQLDDGSFVTPRIKGSLLYDVIGDEYEVASTFVNSGVSYNAEGYDIAQFGGQVDLGLDWEANDGGFVLSVDGNSEFRSDFVGYGGSLTARWKF